MKALLSADPLARKRTVYHQEGKSVTLHKLQDCEPILEHVRARRDAYRRDPVMNYIGEIPMQVIGEMMADGRIGPEDDLKAIRAWFNSDIGREFNASPWRNL